MGPAAALLPVSVRLPQNSPLKTVVFAAPFPHKKALSSDSLPQKAQDNDPCQTRPKTGPQKRALFIPFSSQT